MESKELKMQYGHADGHTSICYTTDGSQILTCGSDGDVRMWKSQDDGDPVSECVGEMVIALAFHGDHFYVGSDTHYVQAYTFPDAKRDGIINRFTAPVSHIAISQDGKYIAAGSCDMEIQVADLDNGNSITKMLGHTAPITGVAIDPASKYLASSSCDGSVNIWDLKTGDSVRSLPSLFPTSNDFFRAIVLGRPSWQGGNGAFLAVPVGKQVTLYDRDSWTATVNLTHPKVLSSFSLVEFSPCGNYLAASTTSGELVVWDVSNQVVIASYVSPKKMAISCLAWRPDSQALAVCDRLGQFSILEDVFDALPEPTPEAPEVVADIENDNEEDYGVSLDEIKRDSGWGSPQKDDEVSSIKSFASASVVASKPTLSVDLQPAFQPSSTPTHFQRRFMVWNAIGIVRCFDTEQEKSIDVEFHDTTFHHTLHINNYEDNNMAALSSNALILASNEAEDSISKLKCVMLNAWDGSKEWTTALPMGENITAVAAAGNWVAASTDMNHLRLFSFAGTQRLPVSVPGQVVCLIGHVNKIGVIFHSSLGLPECQDLAVIVYEVHDLFVKVVVSTQHVALSPRSTLKWAGFTDEGRLCSFDSEGVLRCLASDNQHWAVISDTRNQAKGLSDHYFVLGVSERYQNIRCVLCKGGYYPMTEPRPTVVEIPLKAPLCEPEVEKTGLEDVFWRLISFLPGLETLSETHTEYLSDVADMEKTLKQTVVKLFANACKGDLELRALELGSVMSEQPLQMASKYASKCGKRHLAEKLNDLNPVDWSELRHETSEKIVIREIVKIMPNETATVDDPSYSYSSQRDLFEETPTENKLLRAELDVSTMNLSSTPGNKNPFKVKEQQPKEAKTLSFFDKPLPPKATRLQAADNPALAKKTKKKLAPKSENSQPKEMNFMTWFATQKESMMSEFPELSMPELTKKAMARFRTENRSTSSPASQPADISEESQGFKRKAEDMDISSSAENVKKVASNKLGAFMFRSKN